MPTQKEINEAVQMFKQELSNPEVQKNISKVLEFPETNIICSLIDIKDQYIKAKLQMGDLRGLKAPVDLACKYNLNEMEIAFYATGGKAYDCESGGKTEIEVSILESENSEFSNEVWNWKDLKSEIEQMPEGYIIIYCNIWNKYRTEANKKTVTEFQYKINKK